MDEMPGQANEQANEGRLELTGDQFRLLVESVKDYAIFLLDPNGRIVSWNEGAARLKGYEAREIVGENFSRFYTPADLAAAKPAWELETAAAQGRLEDQGWRVRKDGSLFWADVVLTALHDETGKLVGYAKVTRDLTDRRQAEANARQLAREEARRQAAEESEQRLARVHRDLATALAEREDALARVDAERTRLDTILRQMPVGVMIAEAQTLAFTFANEQAERLFEASLVGKPIGRHGAFHSYHPDGRPFAPGEWPLERAIRQGETVDGEQIAIVTRSGKRMVIALHAAPLRDPAGTITSAVAAFQDITQQKEAQAAAERQAIFREQFIGILGHDLRNPLAAIHAGAQLLLRKGLPEAQARAATRISTSAERMERMISDLLDLTRSRLGGGIPVAPHRADLASICRHVIEEHHIAHPDIDFSFAGAETWGEWDEDRIAQVLSNLIGNAIAYGKSGGPVQVTIRDCGETEVFLDVHNEGPAIPEAIRPFLFEPYSQGGRSTASRGLGLGLFIACAIVKSHGGGIAIDSSDEAGTTFTVRLPRRPPG